MMVKLDLITLTHLQINVIANAYLIDVFLGGEFTTYGLEVLKFLDYPPDKVGVDPK